MNRNPLIPFALIAALGIALVFVLSFIGLNNADELANGGEAGQETAAANPEEIFKGKCSSCHGADLSGGAGPPLTSIEDKYTSEEIQGIIKEGRGIMPPNLVPADKLEEMAVWLMEQK